MWRRASSNLSVLFAVGAMMIAGCASGAGNSAGAPPMDTTPKGVTSNAAVEQILQNSCYSCHSNGGSAPWYAAIAPSYMLSNSARSAMNFSDWNNYDQATKAHARSLAASVIADGEMPPWDFTLLHPSAGLTDSDKTEIAKWAAAAPALPAH
ncbi:MAG TPA: heme-binding domain-containing protein [Candidatus Binataceae bacterium]|nr:heme-binding domain-containing protein [Candidatus Binataceae bacterium]